jgi:hypothetical protein
LQDEFDKKEHHLNTAWFLVVTLENWHLELKIGQNFSTISILPEPNL